MKRVLVLSDLHCGHIAGLTPHLWNDQPPRNASAERKLLYETRHKLFDIYQKEIEKRKPFDVLICNGDAIDGRGERSGGTELLTSDRQEQCDMAAHCLRVPKAKQIYMTYGTPYHTGQIEDWERSILSEIPNGQYKPSKTEIMSHLYLDVDGVVFDCKHKVGSSGIPHGRHTAVAKEDIWNLLWHEKTGLPRGDIFIRSHVHYCQYSGDATKLRMTTPALQSLGSKYGSRQCSGTVDWGFVVFEIDNKGGYSWEIVNPVESVKAQPVKLRKA